MFSENYVVCKKMKQFTGCAETKEFHHCSGFDYSQPNNERLCYDLGCCFDPSKPRTCFRALPNSTISADGSDTGHGAGFAAGMTALTFILLYSAAGIAYFYFFR